MDKKECLQMMMQYFQIESCIVHLKNPDFELKSHIFFYRDTFKDVQEIRIMRVKSKNWQDNILFDIYYVSQSFDGLFNGYFRIKPESEMAERLFQNISKVATDLGHYFYYVYKNSELLKLYFISGSLQNALATSRNRDWNSEFEQIKKMTYLEIANYSVKEFTQGVLRRELLEKYISNFMLMNSKASEKVKMFLINILTSKYATHICLLPKTSLIKNFILVTSDKVLFHGDNKLPIYGLLDYAIDHHNIIFVKLEFDFEGGDISGKAIG